MQTLFTRPLLLKEAKALLFLAGPIIANGLLESSYSFTNAFMAAQLGITELAVNALVSLLFFTLMVIFWGVISATSIIISHYHGAEDTPAIRGVARDSLWLSIMMSIPIMLLLWFASDIFLWTGQSIFVVHAAEKYLHALTWAVPSDLLGFVLMQFFQGISRPRIVFIITLAYIPLLITTNYILIFGKLGFPALGLAGIGWGVTFVYTLVLICLGLYIWSKPFYRKYFNFHEARSQTRYFRELLHVGVPLGGMFSIEIGCFLIVAVFMGKISDVALAANQIIMQFLWVTINVVFSIGQAVSIRIGWRLGRQEPQWVLPLSWLGQSMSFIYMLIIALIYWLFPKYLIALDLSNHLDPTVADLT